MAPPAVIKLIIRPFMLVVEMEKGTVGTVRTDIRSRLISRLFLIDPLPVHPFIKGSAMIKYPVQNNLHPPAVSLLHQLNKKLIAGFQVFLSGYTIDILGRLDIILCPMGQQFSLIHHDLSKMRINIVIVLNIIFMIGGGYKQRIEIDHIHSQLLKIVQLLADSFQVTAIKLPDIYGSRTLSPFSHSAGALSDIDILIAQHIISGIPVIKTVRKNLIHHRTLCPVRCGKARLDTEGVAFTQILCHPQLIIKAVCLSAFYLKIISEGLILYLDLNPVIIKILFRMLKLQRFLHGPADQIYRIHIILCRPKPDRNPISRPGFHGNYVIFCLIT